MTAPHALECEEPAAPNEQLLELVESSGRVELARSNMAGANRYILRWPRGFSLTPEHAHTVLSGLPVLEPGLRMFLVLAWPHDLVGSLRGRHRVMASIARRSGLRVSEAASLAIARIELSAATHPLLQNRILREGTSWVVLWGPGLEIDLSSDPFRCAMVEFAARRKFIPSVEFVAGLGARGAGIAYSDESDGADTRLIVLDRRSLGPYLRRAVAPTCGSGVGD